jgi:hypothetical protein
MCGTMLTSKTTLLLEFDQRVRVSRSDGMGTRKYIQPNAEDKRHGDHLLL